MALLGRFMPKEGCGRRQPRDGNALTGFIIFFMKVLCAYLSRLFFRRLSTDRAVFPYHTGAAATLHRPIRDLTEACLYVCRCSTSPPERRHGIC